MNIFKEFSLMAVSMVTLGASLVALTTSSAAVLTYTLLVALIGLLWLVSFHKE